MKKVLSIDGHILLLSPTAGIDITEQEYEDILKKLEEKPQEPPEGYTYRISDSDLTWELYQMPDDDLIDEEATTEDYQAALAELGVRV